MEAAEGDLQRVLHIHTVETLYAADVDGYVEWRSALVEAPIRAALSGAATVHVRGHELCARRLANLLQLASSYREGREWSWECSCCQFMNGVRNYVAHHWARGHAAFAISAGRSHAGATGTWRDDDDRRPRGYAPHADIDLFSKALKARCKFDAAARALGNGARRLDLAPVVESYLRCLSANYGAWRSENALRSPGSVRPPSGPAWRRRGDRAEADVRRTTVEGIVDTGSVNPD